MVQRSLLAVTVLVMAEMVVAEMMVEVVLFILLLQFLLHGLVDPAVLLLLLYLHPFDHMSATYALRKLVGVTQLRW